jgi:hypothetical protein
MGSVIASDIVLWFTPLYVIAGILLVLLVFSLLARVRGGKYVRPVVNAMAKVPLFKRWMQRASRAALEKQNPELASAIAKLERSGVTRDPTRAQAALSRLTAAERKAYFEAAGQQGQMPQPTNRQERRRLEKMQKRTQGR